jgi:DNA-binding response OmpR family regulator
MANNRLLLIEDDYDVAEMLLMYFQSMDYEVLHADNGSEGIQVARNKFPNLILLDIMLPDMDGYDVCVRLRNLSLTKYIPTIFLTQRDERGSKVRGLELGADDYITKPFDIDELRLRVESSIRRATREHLHEPRTGLPTGPLVDEELKARRSKNAHVLRLRITGFDSYSDVYSFMAANDVIYHAGKIIRDVLSEMGSEDDFVGITSDDFLVATYADDQQALSETINKRFSDQVRTFYTFTDANRGGIILQPGSEDEHFLPIMRFDIQPHSSDETP